MEEIKEEDKEDDDSMPLPEEELAVIDFKDE